MRVALQHECSRVAGGRRAPAGALEPTVEAGAVHRAPTGRAWVAPRSPELLEQASWKRLSELPQPPGGNACRNDERESAHRVNVAGIDLASVRLAVLCAETGSLSAAARHAHMSLSCASHRLSTLEDIVSARLFIRAYQGLTPTTAGRIFVEHARLVLHLVRLIRLQLDALPADKAQEQIGSLQNA